METQMRNMKIEKNERDATINNFIGTKLFDFVLLLVCNILFPSKGCCFMRRYLIQIQTTTIMHIISLVTRIHQPPLIPILTVDRIKIFIFRILNFVYCLFIYFNSFCILCVSFFFDFFL